MNLFVFEHVPHTSTKLLTVFYAVRSYFYAYLVDKGMSEMDAPESEKEQLTLAGHLDQPFPF